MTRKTLILITGMPGSGKTTLTGFFEYIGCKKITMGDIIRDIATERGFEPIPEVLSSIAKEIRDEGGDAILGELCAEKLHNVSEDFIVVDGIRSLAEVEAFRTSFDIVLVAIHSSPKTRYFRLMNRKRMDDTLDWKTFQMRDYRELGFKLGRVIVLADHLIINEGSLMDLKKTFRGLLQKLKYA